MKTIICQQNQPEKSQSFIDIRLSTTNFNPTPPYYFPYCLKAQPNKQNKHYFYILKNNVLFNIKNNINKIVKNMIILFNTTNKQYNK